jgi:hypothetical protein
LEIIVGSGGGAGVFGTEIEPLPLDEQRRIVKNKRNKMINLMKGRTVHDDDDDPTSKEIIGVQNQSYGISLGGTPGGKYLLL